MITEPLVQRDEPLIHVETERIETVSKDEEPVDPKENTFYNIE